VRAVFAGQGLSLFWQMMKMEQRALVQVMATPTKIEFQHGKTQ
jgi:hypothetical protein